MFVRTLAVRSGIAVLTTVRQRTVSNRACLQHQPPGSRRNRAAKEPYGMPTVAGGPPGATGCRRPLRCMRAAGRTRPRSCITRRCGRPICSSSQKAGSRCRLSQAGESAGSLCPTLCPEGRRRKSPRNGSLCGGGSYRLNGCNW